MELKYYFIFFIILFNQEIAKSEEKKTWDIMAPSDTIVRKIPIKVSEGSWMNLDISPDNSTLIFDLLGDIYSITLDEDSNKVHTPRPIATGLSLDTYPKFSPDGKKIGFISDRSGASNIWMMNADGSEKTSLTSEDFRLIYQLDWSPKDNFIVGKKHFTTERSLGTGEIWLYHLEGGEGVPLVKRPNEEFQKELGDVRFSPDGKLIYYTRNITEGNRFEYGQDSNSILFSIESYNIETGKIEEVSKHLGGCVAPTPSPDGKSLAYISRENIKSKLYLKDLNTGKYKKIFDDMDQDLQEIWAITGLYPNMAWSKDSQNIFFWAKGQINKLNVKTLKHSIIKFELEDTREIIDPPRPKIQVAPDTFETKIPRGAMVSYDNNYIVFETLGKLWIKKKDQAPKRLTDEENVMEGYPSWSRDSKSIVFISWKDDQLAHIKSISPNGSNLKTLTHLPGNYIRPHYSPHGQYVVFELLGPSELINIPSSKNPGIYYLDLEKPKEKRLIQITQKGKFPHFAKENDRIFLTENDKSKINLVSMNLTGESKRIHGNSEMAIEYQVCPDGKNFLFLQHHNVYSSILLPGPQEVPYNVHPKKKSPLNIKRESEWGGAYMHCGIDSKNIYYSLGPNLYKNKKIYASLSMKQPLDKPKSSIALIGAKTITMGPMGIIENGLILIHENKIEYVGSMDDYKEQIPSKYKKIMLENKFIMPGLIDAHAHGSYGQDDMNPLQNWESMTNLALGVTTIHNPSSTSSLVFPAQEMQRAGIILSPRIFSTGEVIYGAKNPSHYAPINNYQDAYNYIKRLKEQGAHSIKNYNQLRRDSRQQLAVAGKQQNMQIVAESGSIYSFVLSLIADGNSTIEHNVGINVLYSDFIQFISNSQVSYTPTLVVTFQGLTADQYWRAHTNVFDHPILKMHQDIKNLKKSNARRMIAPLEDYTDDDNARESHKLFKNGVLVSIGAHGQEPGIGAHWELWSFVRGGMTPLEAISAGTITAAKSLGMEQDIGSLEIGKLADLIILDNDPTMDIQNSDKIHAIIQGGRMYDPLTLNEKISGEKKRRPYYWE